MWVCFSPIRSETGILQQLCTMATLYFSDSLYRIRSNSWGEIMLSFMSRSVYSGLVLQWWEDAELSGAEMIQMFFNCRGSCATVWSKTLCCFCTSWHGIRAPEWSKASDLNYPNQAKGTWLNQKNMSWGLKVATEAMCSLHGNVLLPCGTSGVYMFLVPFRVQDSESSKQPGLFQTLFFCPGIIWIIELQAWPQVTALVGDM